MDTQFDVYLRRYMNEMLRSNRESDSARPPHRLKTRQQQLQQHISQKEALQSHPYHCDMQRRTGMDLQFGYLNVANWLNRQRVCARTQATSAPLHVTHRHVPNHTAGLVAKFPGDRVFVGQFSKDGSTFVSAAQGRTIRLFDTFKVLTHLKKTKAGQEEDSQTQEETGTFVGPVPAFKEIEARDVGWSVLDIDFSPDQEFIIYSSWSPYIHLCNVHGSLQVHEALDLEPAASRHFSAFSIRFSPDSREIIAGTSEYALYLYDISQRKRVLRIQAHDDDINTVTFAEEWSANIFFSGADDGLCKVWDRRCMAEGQNPRPVGCLVGHTDGIVYVESRGDGRYVATNSKDQTIKLFDIRSMGSVDTAAASKLTPSCIPQWDYRYTTFPRDLIHPVHPNDMSVMTYRGHCVLQTLVRCHFSPGSTTGHRYIYCGSHNGGIYIYDTLTGDIVRRLMHHSAVTRDVSWHPYLPVLFSTSWDGSHMAFDYQQHDNGSEEPEALPLLRQADTDGTSRRRTFHPPVQPQTQLSDATANVEVEQEETVSESDSHSVRTLHQLQDYQHLRRLQQLRAALLAQYRAELAEEQRASQEQNE